MAFLSAMLAMATGKGLASKTGPRTFWMRNIDGRMARIVSLSEPNVIRYTLDNGDEEYACSTSDWQSFPLWSGLPN